MNNFTKKEFCWGWLIEGTREDIIADGMVPAEKFPAGDAIKIGRLFRPEGNAGYADFLVDHRNVRIRRKSPRRYDVWIEYTEAERKAYEARCELADRAAEARGRLESLVASSEQFTQLLLTNVAVLRLRGKVGLHGFSLGREELDEFEELLQDVADFLRNARVQVDRRAREQLQQPLRAAIARADPGVQRVLALAAAGRK